MNNKEQQLWTLIQRQLPEFIRGDANYDNFIAFLRAYYKFLQVEGSNNPVELISNTAQNRDIDSTIDLFVQQFSSQFLENMPIIYNPSELNQESKQHHRNQISRVAKNSSDLYTEKSVENAYRTLFRILYDEEIEFFYPKTVILKPSDGKWQRDTTLKIQIITGDLDDFNLTYGSATAVEVGVIGETGATATVEKIIATAQTGFTLYELFLTTDTITSQTKKYLSKYAIANPGDPVPVPFAPDNVVVITLGTQVVTANILSVITSYDLISTNTQTYTAGELLVVTDHTNVDTHAVVTVKSVDSTGKVKALSVSDSAYDLDTSVTWYAQDGLGHDVAELNLGGLTHYPGYYTAIDGFLSDQPHIRGPKPSKVYSTHHTPDEYYQEFSYVIRSGISVDKWGDTVRKILHPIGYVVFGDVLLLPETDSGTNILGMYHYNEDDINTIADSGGYLYHILLLYFDVLVSTVIPSVPNAIITAGGVTAVDTNIVSRQSNINGPSNKSFSRFMFLAPAYDAGVTVYGANVPDSATAFTNALAVPAWPNAAKNSTVIGQFANVVIGDYYDDVLGTLKTQFCPDSYITLLSI